PDSVPAARAPGDDPRRRPLLRHRPGAGCRPYPHQHVRSRRRRGHRRNPLGHEHVVGGEARVPLGTIPRPGPDDARGVRGVAVRAVRRAALAVVACICACAPVAAPRSELGPTEQVSLFAYPWSWTDDGGDRLTFARWRGSPIVVTAVYTQC